MYNFIITKREAWEAARRRTFVALLLAALLILVLSVSCAVAGPPQGTQAEPKIAPEILCLPGYSYGLPVMTATGFAVIVTYPTRGLTAQYSTAYRVKKFEIGDFGKIGTVKQFADCSN